MNQNEKKDNDIIQLIGNLSSQSTESSNIILRAISQGISSGISQGIASGNISFSVQDVIALATVFKPNNDITLRLIDGLIPKNLNVVDKDASPAIRIKEHIAVEALANPDSLVSTQDSLELPSSVHVFDVTAETLPAQEHTECQRVSENADDYNTESSHISIVSGVGIADESTHGNMVSLSRKRLLIECTNELDSALELSKNSRPRIETSTFKKDTIESLPELCDYISSISSQIPEAAVTAHNKLSKTNGKSCRSLVRYTNFDF